jgi:hypothetical protein
MIFGHETNEDDANKYGISRGKHASENSILIKPINNKSIHIKDFINDAVPTRTPQRTTVNKENV